MSRAPLTDITNRNRNHANDFVKPTIVGTSSSFAMKQAEEPLYSDLWNERQRVAQLTKQLEQVQYMNQNLTSEIDRLSSIQYLLDEQEQRAATVCEEYFQLRDSI